MAKRSNCNILLLENDEIMSSHFISNDKSIKFICIKIFAWTFHICDIELYADMELKC